MNGNYYKNPKFPTLEEEKVIEDDNTSFNGNLLTLNKGKKVSLMLDDDKSIEGILKNIVGEELIIMNISDDSWYLVPKEIVRYVKFFEKIDFK